MCPHPGGVIFSLNSALCHYLFFKKKKNSRKTTQLPSPKLYNRVGRLGLSQAPWNHSPSIALIYYLTPLRSQLEHRRVARVVRSSVEKQPTHEYTTATCQCLHLWHGSGLYSQAFLYGLTCGMHIKYEEQDISTVAKMMMVRMMYFQRICPYLILLNDPRQEFIVWSVFCYSPKGIIMLLKWRKYGSNFDSSN